jgi:hypothetical protein
MADVSDNNNEWTMAVYIMADGPKGSRELDKQANDTVDVIREAIRTTEHPPRVAIQMDFKTKPGARRVILAKGHEDKQLCEYCDDTTPSSPEAKAPPVIEKVANLREKDSGKVASVAGFFDWINRECQANHYLVHFWGHSNGPVGIFTDFPTVKKNTRPDTLTLPELKEGFKHAKEVFRKSVDLVLFKDCWMSTLETAYQLKGLANYRDCVARYRRSLRRLAIC